MNEIMTIHFEEEIMSNDDIQLAGANAYCLGRTKLDNPYYQSMNMPKSTGETIEEWQAKAVAWELGYQVEYMIVK